MSQTTNYKAELVGVFGHPVAENPTIVMQEAGFQAMGLNWRYLNIEVYPEDFQTLGCQKCIEFDQNLPFEIAANAAYLEGLRYYTSQAIIAKMHFIPAGMIRQIRQVRRFPPVLLRLLLLGLRQFRLAASA